MDNFVIKQGRVEDMDLIKPLWEKLNLLHYDLSPHFKSRYKNMRWDKRKHKIISKSGSLLFEYATDWKGLTIIGYCISTIDKDDNKTGEIDSIYIEEAFRKSGLGKRFIERAIHWLESNNVETQKLIVGVGNEQVLDFYKHFDFYPLHIVLQRMKGEEK